MKDNQSSRFLLPLLDVKNPRFFDKEGFKGCFISDVDKPQWDGRLLLVYDYQATGAWGEFELQLMKIPEFIGSYFYKKDSGKALVVYGFSTESFKEDFDKVLEGKYSQISPENKLKITKFWRTYSGSFFNSSIINKSDEMKFYWAKVRKNPEDHCAKNEVWYTPDLNEETFNKNNYIKD